jgi:Rod binding domain-containing protein
MTVQGSFPASSLYPVRYQQAQKPIDKTSDLYKACEDFESLFIKQMLDVMRKTVEKNGLFDGGIAEDIYEDMLYDEYAKKMAQTAQFGLAETIYRQVSSKA